jgi:hypothetical protein
MSLNLFSLFGARRRKTPRARRARPPSYFRPCLEGFEDRVVPAAPVLNAAQVAPAALLNNIAITGVQLTNFQIVDNVLHATGTVTGTLAGLPFTTTISDFALQLVPDDPSTTQVECSVLHLHLDPIHLRLLGLHVDTSPICLDITAIQGGGILGDLLCGLAGGGVGGLGIPTIPTGTQLTDLVGGLTDVLNGVLNNTAAKPAQGDDTVCTGKCEVLDLTLGPLDLTLLGLRVQLNDCADPAGPVEVCISATRSEGILGSLLCGLSHSRILGLSFGDITQLGSTATALLADGTLSGRDVGTLASLFAHLVK